MIQWTKTADNTGGNTYCNDWYIKFDFEYEKGFNYPLVGSSYYFVSTESNKEETKGENMFGKYNVYENEEGRLYVFLLPGVQKEDIELKIGKKGFVVKVNIDDEFEDYEVIKSGFDYYDEEKIKVKIKFDDEDKFDIRRYDASYENGFLRVFVPFVEEHRMKKAVIA